MKKNTTKCFVTVNLEKQGNNDGTIPILLQTKKAISTNRDGLVVGTVVTCNTDNGYKTATSCKEGYIMDNEIYLNLSSLTSAAYNRKIYTNPLSLWCTEEGKSIREYAKELLQ